MLLTFCNKGKISGHRKSPNMKLKHSIKGLCLELWLFVCSFWYKFEPWRRGRKTIACSPGSKRHVKGSVYFHIGISTRMVPIHINLCVENCPHCINNRSFFLQIQPRETFARAAPFFLDGLDINWLEREVGRSVRLKRSRYKKLSLSFKKYKMSQKTRHHIKLARLKGAAGSLVIWGCFDTS